MCSLRLHVFYTFEQSSSELYSLINLSDLYHFCIDFNVVKFFFGQIRISLLIKNVFGDGAGLPCNIYSNYKNNDATFSTYFFFFNIHTNCSSRLVRKSLQLRCLATVFMINNAIQLAILFHPEAERSGKRFFFSDQNVKRSEMESDMLMGPAQCTKRFTRKMMQNGIEREKNRLLASQPTMEAFFFFFLVYPNVINMR